MVARARTGDDARTDLLRELEEGPGYVVLRRFVPDHLVEGGLRRLNLEILRCGITAAEIGEWKFATFWPSLRWEPEILALRQPLEELMAPGPDEAWGDAQLLLRFPDEAEEWPLEPHVDDLPDDVGDRAYEAIFGVALSRSSALDGCVTVWTGSHRGEDGPRHRVELDAGDVVALHPRVGHSSTLNRGGTIRYAVYFRLLGAPPR